MKQYISPAILDHLRAVRRHLLRLKKCFVNSAKAFRPDDVGYKLAISRFCGFEVAYREGTADEAVIKHSFDNDMLFPGIPEYRLQPNHVIIDVGAHIGTFSLLAASKVPQGKIFAAEACKETFDFLKINVALNHPGNIEIRHIALSDKMGKIFLHYDEGNWGHSIMKQLSAKGEEVGSDTLDNFMSAIGRCDFIKFNCEGAEFPILMGASKETLSKISMMLILYHCDLAESYTLDSMIGHLQNNGFKTRIRNQTTQRGWLIAEHK